MTATTNAEIDHDALLARADSLPPTDGIGADCLITQMALAIRALRDQREADARDAARYRFIRDNDVGDDELWCYMADSFDAAIDAAMASEVKYGT